jgi:fimbrial isopeptide formation D2 family protein
MNMRSLALRAAVATAAVTLGVVTLPLFGAPAGASVWTPPANPALTAPFNECPAIHDDTGCGFLIILPKSGPAQIVADNTQGPYDGNDDTLVGIVNQTGFAIPSVALSSSTDIFGFDGDGLCTFTFTGNTGCPFGSTGYEGPGTSFSGYSSSNGFKTGNVNFSGAGLASGSSTFFSLESSLSGANFTIPASFVVTKAASPSSGVIAGSSTPIVYTLTADNIGGTTGSVTITDTVPTGTTLIGGSDVCGTIPSGASCAVGLSGSTITWTVSNVPAGDSATVGFQVTANANDQTGTIPNTGNWSGPGCTAPISSVQSGPGALVTGAPDGALAAPAAPAPTTCPTNTTNTPVTATIPVVITADDTTTNYGTAPTVGYMISGDSDGAPATGPTCSSTVTATTAVGTYTGANTCTGASDPRYTFTYKPGNATVNPATLTVTASSYSMVYGGPTQPITSQITGFVNSQNSSVLTTLPTCSAPVTNASPVGTYTSSCSGAVAPNYSFHYVNGTVAVTRHPLLITASSGTMTYGGTVPTITPGYSGLVNGDTAPSTPPTCSTTATSHSPVGPYPSTCTGASDPNYSITYAPGSVVIGTHTLLITASSETSVYGSTPGPITPGYSGLVNGDTAPSTPPTCSTTATSASPVGPYPSSCTGASDPNYTISYAPGTVDVTKAPLTITASSESSVYGSTPGPITPGYSGLVNGDTAPSTPPTCGTTATGSSPVGTYPSTCAGASDPNYTISYVDGTVDVTKAPLTITASSGSMTYGGTVSTVTPHYAGFVNGDSSSSLSTKPTCSTTATSSSPASPPTYPSSCSGAVDPNYTINYVDGAVTVNPAPLTITASSPEVIVGGTLPTVVAGYTGFVNGDDPSSLTTAPTCTSTATASSPTGTYKASCHGAVDPNYDITYVDGSLVITNGFTVTKSVSPQSGVVVGSSTPIVYTLTATNAGTATTQTPLSVSDTVPTGTTLVAGSPACKGGPPSCATALSGSTITWKVPAGVAPGTVYSLTFSVTANANDAAGTISNTATWTGPGCLSAPCSTNTASTTVAAAPATAAATTPTTAAPAPTTSPAIAFTGARLTEEWMAAAAAILLGAGLVLVARRRRRPARAGSED